MKKKRISDIVNIIEKLLPNESSNFTVDMRYEFQENQTNSERPGGVDQETMVRVGRGVFSCSS